MSTVVDYGVYGYVKRWWDYIARTTGKVPYIKDVIRVSNSRRLAPWEQLYTDGPYLIFFYRLGTQDSGTWSATLSIEIDGVLVHSALCYRTDAVGDSNYDFLIGGNIFNNLVWQHNKTSAPMLARNSIKLYADNFPNRPFDWQIFQFGL